MRFFRAIVLSFLILSTITPHAAEAARKAAPRYGVNDPRYAALIMNPETGEVYHSRSADARRYPASLTKMMTLYLLFEDLEAKKLSLSSRLKVSQYATTMPQTNISLRVTDTVPVETAIKALIIRSANDVAVVVAENLNGSVANFATRATNKARALGMNHTVFKNPHGLPNDGQYTTARDMAKLGIALKRDFPTYYRYFSDRQFSWKGVTYYTHNRVMLRYSGTDGIKTGFINKSGFNVVTSTTRGGRPLVGVVMGGASGGWRDSQMIALMDKSYKIIASRGQKRGRVFVQNLPKPRAGTAAPSVSASPKVVARAKPVVVETKPVMAPSAPAATTVVSEVRRPAAMHNSISVTFDAPNKRAPQKPAPQTLDAQLAARQELPANTASIVELGWGIQVGAFSSEALAEQAIRLAHQQAAANLEGARMAIIGTGQAGNAVHRARLENLSEKQAKKACEVLISYNSPCFIFRTDTKSL